MGLTLPLWAAKTEEGASIALPPLASPPSGLRLDGGGAVLDLACGGRLDLGGGWIGWIGARESGLRVFEVDGLGNVRRGTRVGIDFRAPQTRADLPGSGLAAK